MNGPELHVISLTVGSLGVECYLASCPLTRESVLIDPGGDADLILGKIKEEKLLVTRILLTHGHGDHIGALREIRGAMGIPVFIHADDAQALTDPMVNMSAYFGTPMIADPPDGFLEEGMIVRVGEFELRVLHTPGHSPGGVCLLGHDLVFTGDTLFKDGIGRTDLPGGSTEELLESIRTKLLPLDDGIFIYPGHGPPSTIGHERQNNPFLRDLE
jgi:hydroxyacylglutathione hydrolase